MHDINELKRAIVNLREEDAKAILFQIFLREGISKDDPFNRKLNTMKQLLLEMAEENPAQKTVHIVFNNLIAESIRTAFAKSKFLKSDKIITMPDTLLFMGPLYEYMTTAGQVARLNWFNEHVPHDNNEFDNLFSEVAQAIAEMKKIAPQCEIVIWTAHNATEQTAMRLVLALLADHTNEISLFNVFHAFHSTHTYPQLMEENYPSFTSDLSVEQCLDLYSYYEVRPIKPAKLEHLQQEGTALMQSESDRIRTWEFNELWHNDDESFDDKQILQYIEENMPQATLIADIISDITVKIQGPRRNTWLMYRIKQLVESGALIAEGELTDRFTRVKRG